MLVYGRLWGMPGRPSWERTMGEGVREPAAPWTYLRDGKVRRPAVVMR